MVRQQSREAALSAIGILYFCLGSSQCSLLLQQSAFAVPPSSNMFCFVNYQHYLLGQESTLCALLLCEQSTSLCQQSASIRCSAIEQHLLLRQLSTLSARSRIKILWSSGLSAALSMSKTLHFVNNQQCLTRQRSAISVSPTSNNLCSGHRRHLLHCEQPVKLANYVLVAQSSYSVARGSHVAAQASCLAAQGSHLAAQAWRLAAYESNTPYMQYLLDIAGWLARIQSTCPV